MHLTLSALFFFLYHIRRRLETMHEKNTIDNTVGIFPNFYVSLFKLKASWHLTLKSPGFHKKKKPKEGLWEWSKALFYTVWVGASICLIKCYFPLRSLKGIFNSTDINITSQYSIRRLSCTRVVKSRHSEIGTWISFAKDSAGGYFRYLGAIEYFVPIFFTSVKISFINVFRKSPN